MAQPVSILAFSHDQSSILPKVGQEMIEVGSAFVQAGFTTKPKWKVGDELLAQLFREYKDEQYDIRVIHFGGHAGETFLKVNIEDDGAQNTRPVYAEGLAKLVGTYCQNLKLLFLNGCSTEDQAKYFLENGVAAVITTTLPVKDEIAFLFAKQFYAAFLETKQALTLRESFNSALNFIKGRFNSAEILNENGQINNLWLHHDENQMRGSFNFKREFSKGDPLYQLHIHPHKSSVEHETVKDWDSFQTPALKEKTEDDPTRIPQKGVMPNRYLICNRAKQYPEFEKVLNQKKDGGLPLPYFFFVHDLEDNCPDDLCERFTDIGLQELCLPGKQADEEIEIYEDDLFQGGNPNDPANESCNLFKTRLSELYKARFEGEPAHNNLLCKLSRRPGDEQALVVLHRLSADEWNGAYDPDRETELRQKIETLLRYYIGEFSDYLKEGFSERLIVVFSLLYYQPDGFFPGLLQQLETEFTNSRVKVLGNLPSVTRKDVTNWQRNVFGTTHFAVGDCFKNEKGQPTSILPFLKTKEILLGEIKNYNKKFNKTTT